MTGETFTYLIVTEDGSSEVRHHSRTGADALDDVVRAALDCELLELIPVALAGVTVWCDEEGGQRRRAPNRAGSLLPFALGGRAVTYVGPIVVTGDRRGQMASLTLDQIDMLNGLLTQLSPPPAPHV